MNYLLTNQDRENSLIGFYFDLTNGYKVAGIKRAYRDLNRTLKITTNQSDRNNIRLQAFEKIIEILSDCLITEFRNQEEFDKFHFQMCKKLREFWKELTFGHCQKWINMTLKYWLILGEERINGIEYNSRFFHIPIDRIILKNMFNEKKPKPWSKINNYSHYMKYQLDFRRENPDKIPIIEELRLFNSVKELSKYNFDK